MNKAGLFTFFFANMIYAKAAMIQMKNLIIKLTYIPRTDALGFVDLSDRWEAKNDKTVATKRIKLPARIAVPSIPDLSKTFVLPRNKIRRKENAQK